MSEVIKKKSLGYTAEEVDSALKKSILSYTGLNEIKEDLREIYPANIYNTYREPNYTTTTNGLTFTVGTDGSVHVTGKKTVSAAQNFELMNSARGEGFAGFETGLYLMTGCPNGGSMNTYRTRIKVTRDGVDKYIPDYGNPNNIVSIDLEGITSATFAITIYTNEEVDLIFKPVFRILDPNVNIKAAVNEIKEVSNTNKSNIDKISYILTKSDFVEGMWYYSGVPSEDDKRIRSRTTIKCIKGTYLNIDTKGLYVRIYQYDTENPLDGEIKGSTTWFTGRKCIQLRSNYFVVNVANSNVYETATKMTPEDFDCDIFVMNTLSSESLYGGDVFEIRNTTPPGTSTTVSGLTFTVLDDFLVSVSGTNTSESEVWFTMMGATLLRKLETGVYSLSGCPTGGGDETYSIRLFEYNDYKESVDDVGSGATAKIDVTDENTTACIALIIQPNVTVDNLVFNPELRPIGTLCKVMESTYALKAITPNVHKYSIRNFTRLLKDIGKSESFLFFTDFHIACIDGWEHNYETAMNYIQNLYGATPTNFVLSGGDWLQSHDTQDDALYKLSVISSGLKKKFGDRFVALVGNHDTNYQGVISEDNNSIGTLTQTQIDNTFSSLRGKSYFKYNANTFAMYCFDTGAYLEGTEPYAIEQIKWFANGLLNGSDEHIVIALHALRWRGETESMKEFPKEITKCADAYNRRGTYTIDGQTFNFVNCTGKVAFLISGHEHADGDVIINNIQCVYTINSATMGRYRYIPIDLCAIDWDAGKLYMHRCSLRRANENTRIFDITV